ncbi:FecR family protein [Mucilaginibacter sabulilitoris]|uniref:FecR family protein n=1 Tax=Mucilaginibacter sabulilitoris TaxID=1173583 RepID=A0ABZ0TJZ5_9SPHI|nr:FecR family protein [Mucilaginibacter sabulilitoris]WPU93144.1 FecR family protein [Mucilaginibacter sabulilitoris]
MSQSIPDQFFEKLKNQQQSESDHLQLTEWFRTASEAEIEEVLNKYSWYFQNEPDERYPENGYLANLIESKLNEAEGSSESNKKLPKQKNSWPFIKKIAAMAAMLCALGLFYYFFKDKKTPEFSAHVTHAAKIVPGGNKAMLTLGNGKVIVLDSAHNGMLASQGGVHVYKSKNGRLVYDVSKYNAQPTDELTYNTISTPRGGQYQVVLPDGSKVWLNAQSSLKFPARFTDKQRSVTLEGEAYFEVAKDKMHPFKVSVNNTEVVVLGTHFNIMGYNDEDATTTTLLEGSVKIIKGNTQQMIVPGQQAMVKQDITVKNVNVNEAVEWKNGNFNFAHEKLQSIMRKIARWYDVDVDYEGKTTSATFVGTIPRSQNITEVLKYLELTGLVHFKITERRITAMP